MRVTDIFEELNSNGDRVIGSHKNQYPAYEIANVSAHGKRLMMLRTDAQPPGPIISSLHVFNTKDELRPSESHNTD